MNDQYPRVSGRAVISGSAVTVVTDDDLRVVGEVTALKQAKHHGVVT